MAIPRRRAHAAPAEQAFAPPPAKPPTVASYASGLNVILGVWLMLAPYVLGYTDSVDLFWNDVLTGAAIVLFSLLRLVMPDRMTALSWLNLVLGAWLALAALILDRGSGLDPIAATANDLIVGVFVMLLAFISAAASRIARNRNRSDSAETTGSDEGEQTDDR